MLKLYTLKPAGRLSSLLLTGAIAFVLAVAGAFVGVFGQASVAHAEPSDDPALEQTVESD